MWRWNVSFNLFNRAYNKERCNGWRRYKAIWYGRTIFRNKTRFTYYTFKCLCRSYLWSNEEVREKEFVKAMYIDEPDILDAAIAKIPKEFKNRFTMVKSAPFYLEILGKTTNKGAALLHLAERLGIQQEETMAIGDEENDRSMLEVVGHAVVMENGNPTLKKIATHITKSNDESGVAYAIRKWVL